MTEFTVAAAARLVGWEGGGGGRHLAWYFRLYGVKRMIGLYIQATQHSNIISLHLFPRFEYSSVPCTATVCLPNSCQLLTTPKFPMLLALYVSTLSFEPYTNRMVYKSPLSHPTGLPYQPFTFQQCCGSARCVSSAGSWIRISLHAAFKCGSGSREKKSAC